METTMEYGGYIVITENQMETTKYIGVILG